MTQMSWTHSSKILALGVVLALALGTAGVATAVTFDDSQVPDELQAGEQGEVRVTVEDPFVDQPDTWTLQATSEFQSANINIRAQTVGGDTITGSNGQITLNADDGVESVEIIASGTVPEIQSHSYENPDQENFVALSVSGDGVQNQWEVHRYTEGSQEARQAIDNAVDRTSMDNSDVQTAISLYNSGDDFDQATSVAQDVVSSQESQEQSQTMLLVGGAAVVLIVLLGGGFYLYSQKQKNTNNLQ
jgi:hypothetical protein